MTFEHAAVVDETGRLGPGSADAVVPWWSFTKILIAAAVLILAERGRIALDRPLDGAPFTPRQLLQHRSGLGDYGRLDAYQRAVMRGGEPWSDEDLFAHVPLDRLAFAPGTGWAYSNVGYLVLRRLIERVDGGDLGESLRRLVLDPLGLPGSRLARSRADMRSTVFKGGRDYHPGWAFHGFVVGPVCEATLALHRLLTSDVLSRTSRAAMLRPHPIGSTIPGRPWAGFGYGLGVAMGMMTDGSGLWEVVGHSAAGPGSVGAVYALPSGRTAAAFCSGDDEGLAEREVLAGLTASASPARTSAKAPR